MVIVQELTSVLSGPQEAASCCIGVYLLLGIVVGRKEKRVRVPAHWVSLCVSRCCSAAMCEAKYMYTVF
jgi:hypothetical protein